MKNCRAFPVPGGTAEDGMTLRDYFAGQAIIGLIASGRWAEGEVDMKPHLVADAYRVADMMLVERAKELMT